MRVSVRVGSLVVALRQNLRLPAACSAQRTQNMAPLHLLPRNCLLVKPLGTKFANTPAAGLLVLTFYLAGRRARRSLPPPLKCVGEEVVSVRMKPYSFIAVRIMRVSWSSAWLVFARCPRACGCGSHADLRGVRPVICSRQLCCRYFFAGKEETSAA